MFFLLSLHQTCVVLVSQMTFVLKDQSDSFKKSKLNLNFPKREIQRINFTYPLKPGHHEDARIFSSDSILIDASDYKT